MPQTLKQFVASILGMRPHLGRYELAKNLRYGVRCFRVSEWPWKTRRGEALIIKQPQSRSGDNRFCRSFCFASRKRPSLRRSSRVSGRAICSIDNWRLCKRLGAGRDTKIVVEKHSNDCVHLPRLELLPCAKLETYTSRHRRQDIAYCGNNSSIELVP